MPAARKATKKTVAKKTTAKKQPHAKQPLKKQLHVASSFKNPSLPKTLFRQKS
ncbi:MAG: hypothetical protein KatS3mg087_0415 [Patescibacteria group bacterium]|nr:MAG: hypothetical protein KatS3mg087_0415 [Patescibacteria group bacterium]